MFYKIIYCNIYSKFEFYLFIKESNLPSRLKLGNQYFHEPMWRLKFTNFRQKISKYYKLLIKRCILAVYTNITESELEDFLLEYDIGQLKALHKIDKGVENSNYFVDTEQGRFILTIYEKRVDKSDLPFFLDLKQHLVSKDFLCPLPINTKEGHNISSIANKPAAIISFLEGKDISKIKSAHCYELGRRMAEMHCKAQDFSGKRDNNFSLPSWVEMFNNLSCKADRIKPGLADKIKYELDYLQENWPTDLPKGIIHADLFPDNVFFLNNNISGIIDFYFACTDFMAYDIAICLNAWCFEKSGEFNITKSQKLIEGYNSVRKLSAKEVDALPILASGAAMRFLLTRLHDWPEDNDSNALVIPKDPLEYMRKLLFHKGLTKASAYGVYAYE